MEIDTSRPVEPVTGSVSDSKQKVELGRIAGPIHFIGIGGIGMSALALLLLARGAKVSGSDKAASPITEELKALGADIHIGHKAENLGKAEAVVVSTAITRENPELARALDNDIPVYHRSEVLAFLSSSKKLVAVSGTHGKTTTTGMVAQALMDTGNDPSVVVGGIFAYMKSNAHAGKSEYFVAEADESDRSHETLPSEIAVVTNIEPDHLENYPGGMEQILATMASFANKARRCVVLCADDAGCRQLQPLLKGKVVTYGTRDKSPSADYTLELDTEGGFTIYNGKTQLGTMRLAVPGMHNKMNTLAAIAVCMELGVPFEGAARALETFHGVARRFEHIGESYDILVVDDYAHHPTEVRATLEAAQQFRRTNRPGKEYGRIVAVFQPHQPGRLRDLWDEFCGAFPNADLVLLADVYVARGGQIEGINSEKFAQAVKHDNAHYVQGPVSELPAKVKAHLKPGDIVLTIGAGDITGLGKPLLALIRNEGFDGTNN